MKPNNILVKHYAGSIAYGTNLPESDVDFRGIFYDTNSERLSPWSTPRLEIWEDKDEEDTVYTELHKYLNGYVNGSPNVMETLWVDKSDIVQSTEAYEILRSHRSDLLSSKLRYSFGGYALGQLKRMAGHNKWINNPCGTTPPVRADYFKLVQNFQEEKLLSKSFDIHNFNKAHLMIPYGGNIFGIVKHYKYRVLNEDGSIHKVDYSDMPEGILKVSPIIIVKLCEDEFKADLDYFKNYWTWKNKRNEKRSELEELHGYDTKHAMHVVRLLRMCKELLDTGEIIVKRPDAQELLDIRHGKWKYNELIEWAEGMDSDINKSMKTSDLPKAVDLSKAKEILFKVQDSMYG